MQRRQALLAVSFAAAPALAAAQSSTFDASAQGWTNVTLPCSVLPCQPPTNPPTQIGNPAPVVFHASGGNPGGWISATDPDGVGAGNSQYWRAPSGYHGNKSASFGGSLKYDILQTTSFGSFEQEDVLLVGGGSTLSASNSFNPTPHVWTSYSVPIQVGTWRVGGIAGPLATEAQIKAVLANVTEIYVRAEYQLNIDTHGLDNVVLAGTCSTVLGSSELVRVGSPPNPAAFQPGLTSGPVVAQTWDPFVDHAAFLPSAIADVLALTALPAQLPSSMGTILCDIGTGPLFTFVKPAGVPFALAIPADCSLVGVQLCTQAASVSGAAIALTNALDITIGSH